MADRSPESTAEGRAETLRTAIANAEHFREHSIIVMLGGIYRLAVDGAIYWMRKELTELGASRCNRD